MARERKTSASLSSASFVEPVRVHHLVSCTELQCPPERRRCRDRDRACRNSSTARAVLSSFDCRWTEPCALTRSTTSRCCLRSPRGFECGPFRFRHCETDGRRSRLGPPVSALLVGARPTECSSVSASISSTFTGRGLKLYSYAAFKDVAHAELLADLADRYRSAFVSERGGPRDDKAAGKRA